MDDDNSLESIAQDPRLTTQWVGRHCDYFPQTGSTNLALREAAQTAVLPPGTVYVTDFQTAGRGRLQRTWTAPPRTSLLFSTLFKPDWPAQQSAWLMMLGGLAVVQALAEQTAVAAQLKWPNDVVVIHEGQVHKLAGLLLEGVFDGHGRFQSAVLGIGLNVNIPADALPAAHTPPTSLQVLTGTAVDRRPLMIALLNRLETLYEQAANGLSPHGAWSDLLINLGQPVEVTLPETAVTLIGVAEAVDELGQLKVRTADSQIHTIQSGDVTLRSL